MNNIVLKILELSEKSRKEAEKYEKKRFLFKKIIDSKGKHFKGIVGARGTGKTILLKQLSSDLKDSVYISTDILPYYTDLFSLIKELNEKYRIKTFLIDEIHFNKEYTKYLKNIYDFLDVNIIFTSSVSLSLIKSSYDLSRRVKLYYLYPFSIREFIFFKENVLLPIIDFSDLQKGNYEKYLRYEYLFEDYLKGGNYPFSLEEPFPLSLLENILKKIVYTDIPAVWNLNYSELNGVENILKFIGKSHPEGMSFSSIAKNVGITKYKAAQYLKLLEKSFVLNIIYPKGTNVLKEPKVLMKIPYRLLYKDFEDALGYIKEDFTADMLKAAGIEFYYLKSRRGKKTPDFLINHNNKEFVIEVGGRGKGRAQFKGIEIKNKLILTYPSVTGKNKAPLFLAGFLY